MSVDDFQARSLRIRLSIGDRLLDGAGVTRFRVAEALSHCYQLAIDLESVQPIDRDGTLGKPAAVILDMDSDARARHFHGVVTGFRTLWTSGSFYATRLSITPKLGLLRLGRDHRIFPEGLTIPDVVEQVIRDAAIDIVENECSFEIDDSYQPHASISQWGESDYEFMSRLLAEEGIAFAVRNDEIGARFVFFDGTSESPSIEGEEIGFMAGRDVAFAVHAIEETQRAASDVVILRDYDPADPSKPVDARVPKESSSVLEVYDPTAAYPTPEAAPQRAQRRLEWRKRDAHTIRGVTDCQYFEPGRWFRLQGHPRRSMNVEYTIVSVDHTFDLTASRLQYSNEFVAISRDVLFRPDPLAAPVVGGVHTGIIAGPAGAELHGSAHGESKIRFPWDRSGRTDDTASAPCRVGQLPLPNSMIMPRVGFEVVADTFNHDPDRLLVTGRLYNAHDLPPYADSNVVSSVKTNTTGGGSGANELRFDDTAGAEEMLFNASFDQVCEIRNDSRFDVTNDESVVIGGNNSVKITQGNYEGRVIGNRGLFVETDQTETFGADFNEGVGTDDSLTVTGCRDVHYNGDLVESVKGSLTRSVGGLRTLIGIVGINRQVIGDSKITVKGMWNEFVNSTISQNCGLLRIETVGGLKMIRADTFAVDCVIAYVQNAGSLTIDTKGSRTDETKGDIKVTANGGMNVRAKTININAASRLALSVGGTEIKMDATSITVKTQKAYLVGVKKLTSKVSHGSGP